MESSFTIVAEPSRRAILSLLASADHTVGEMERELRLSQTAVSKHLRVLREAGLVEARVHAQHRVYRIRPAPLQEIDVWMEPFRRFWAPHFDALERHLDRVAGCAALGPNESASENRAPAALPLAKEPRAARPTPRRQRPKAKPLRKFP